MGQNDDTRGEHSVVNTYGQVRKMKNMWLGGNGVIDKGTACNPTLPFVALAIRSSRKIAKEMKIHEEEEVDNLIVSKFEEYWFYLVYTQTKHAS